MIHRRISLDIRRFFISTFIAASLIVSLSTKLCITDQTKNPRTIHVRGANFS